MMRHGNGKYTHEGCRCDVCRSAHNEAAVQFRKQRLNKEVPSFVTHGLSAYNNWGCRCEECVKANRNYQREYMRKYYANKRNNKSA